MNFFQHIYSFNKTITYTYDSMNRRVARTNEKGTTQYLYGNPNHPFQLTAVRSPSGSLSRYHYDDFGLLFALERDNNWYYITTDQLGTPRVVCDANGTLVKVLEYDSFGQVIADCYPEFELHISFAGGLIDVETELVRFGFRDYDAVAGKWTAKDPIGFAGGDGNLYGYVINNPIMFVDLDGLEPRYYYMYDPLHGGEHIDRYNSAGKNVGRYQLDGTPLKGEKCPAIPKSELKRFNMAATRKLKGVRFGLFTNGVDILHMGFELIDTYREANKAGITFQQQWDLDQKEYERYMKTQPYLVIPFTYLVIPNPDYQLEI